MKKKIHPIWFTNAIVFYDGKPLCSVGSTKQKLQIDIWLANHSFYKKLKITDDTEDTIKQFINKYELK